MGPKKTFLKRFLLNKVYFPNFANKYILNPLLNFGMCIKDPINKTCWKMVKICQTGLLKLNFETVPKKAFNSFCQQFLQAMDEVEIFFCQFPNS